MGKITKNAFRCKKCGMVVESKSVHDYQECKCGNFTDGGHEYIRRGGNMKDMEDMSEPKIDFEKLKKEAKKKGKKITKEDMLDIVTDGVDDLISAAHDEAESSYRVSKIQDKVSLILAIVACVSLVLSNFIEQSMLLVIGGLVFAASIIFDLKSETSFVKYIAMKSHEDQLRHLKAMAMMAKELDLVINSADKAKKGKKNGK